MQALRNHLNEGLSAHVIQLFPQAWARSFSAQLLQVWSGHTGMHRYLNLLFRYEGLVVFFFKDYLAYFIDSKYKVTSGRSLKLQGTDPQINSSVILLCYSLKTKQGPNHTAAVSVHVNSRTDNI